MGLKEQLLQLELGFWNQGADYYREHVDLACLVAFTELAGVRGIEEIAAMNPGASNWREAKFSEKGFLTPSENFAILCYEARAQRHDGEPYHAIVSSGYVRRGKEWKLAFHQQTPL